MMAQVVTGFVSFDYSLRYAHIMLRLWGRIQLEAFTVPRDLSIWHGIDRLRIVTSAELDGPECCISVARILLIR
jgi:hypothetical protein